MIHARRGHPLLEPAFQRHLRRVLARRRIPPKWLDDAVGEVIVRALEACEDADVFEPLVDDTWRHWLDAKKLALMLADLFARGVPEMGWEILEAVICDEEAKSIAEEFYLSEDAARGRLKRMRAKFCELVEESGLSHLRLPEEKREDTENGAVEAD